MTQPVSVAGTWSYPVSALVAGEVLTARLSSGSDFSDFSPGVTVLPALLPAAPVITGTPYHAGDTAVNGTGVVGATITLLLNGVPAGSATVSAGGVWTASVAALTEGAVLSATATTAAGTSAQATPTTVLAASGGGGPAGGTGYLLLDVVVSGHVLLETGDALLLETGNGIALEAGGRLLLERAGASGDLLLETGDALLYESSDKSQLEGSAFAGGTVTDLLLLENIHAAAATGVVQRRTYGRARVGSRGWGN